MAHEVLGPEPGCGRDRLEIAEHAMRLRLDAFGKLHRRRIEPDLARQIDRVAGAHRLRIGADRLGRVARLDRGLHAGYLSLMISALEKLLGTPRDGALLRYSLGLEYAKAGDHERAIEHLREAVTRDPLYSAAWKTLGKLLADAKRRDEALEAYRHGIEAAQKKGDKQALKEMTVFARRLEKDGA